MKRIFCLIGLIAMIPALFACSPNKDSLNMPVTFYYCTDPEDYEKTMQVFSSEQRESEAYADNMHGLLQLYLQGPTSPELLSPFPDNVQLERISIHGTGAQVVLSSEFTSLMDADLTVACSCLTLTVQSLTGAQTVTISAVDTYGVSQFSITMSGDDLLLADIATATE